LIRARQEQRKKQRSPKKTKFRACVKVRKDYTYGVHAALSREVSHNNYKINRDTKFFGMQIFTILYKHIYAFDKRYIAFYKPYNFIYPINQKPNVSVEKIFKKKNILSYFP